MEVAFGCIWLHRVGREAGAVPAGGLGEVVGVGVRAHIAPLLRGAVLRERDLARAAKAKKVGFSADFEGYFLIFGFGGGARGM